MLLKNQWVNAEIKNEIRTYLKTNENKNTTFQNDGLQQSSPKREVQSDTGLPQETSKVSGKQPNITSKCIRKRTNKAQSQQKGGNNKDQRGNK